MRSRPLKSIAILFALAGVPSAAQAQPEAEPTQGAPESADPASQPTEPQTPQLADDAEDPTQADSPAMESQANAVDAESPPSQPPPAPPSVHDGPTSNDAVVRGQAGDWGMFFRFSGLAEMAHFGPKNRNVAGGVVLSSVGFKAVFSEQWMLPFYFGTVLRLDDPPDTGAGSDSQTNWGIELGGGFEYHFRIWRRISPFFGATLGLGYVDPSGADNHTFGLGLGPVVGVETYIADRISLTASYTLVFQFELQQVPAAGGLGGATSDSQFFFQFDTQTGGGLTITYYF